MPAQPSLSFLLDIIFFYQVCFVITCCSQENKFTWFLPESLREPICELTRFPGWTFKSGEQLTLSPTLRHSNLIGLGCVPMLGLFKSSQRWVGEWSLAQLPGSVAQPAPPHAHAQKSPQPRILSTWSPEALWVSLWPQFLPWRIQKGKQTLSSNQVTNTPWLTLPAPNLVYGLQITSLKENQFRTYCDLLAPQLLLQFLVFWSHLLTAPASQPSLICLWLSALSLRAVCRMDSSLNHPPGHPAPTLPQPLLSVPFMGHYQLMF